jgi:hypothetical protein
MNSSFLKNDMQDGRIAGRQKRIMAGLNDRIIDYSRMAGLNILTFLIFEYYNLIQSNIF